MDFILANEEKARREKEEAEAPELTEEEMALEQEAKCVEALSRSSQDWVHLWEKAGRKPLVPLDELIVSYLEAERAEMVTRDHVERFADFAGVDPVQLAMALEVPPKGFSWKQSVVSFLLAWARGRFGWSEPVLSKAELGRLEREQILAESMKEKEMETVSHTAGAKAFVGMLKHKWGRYAIGRAWRQLLDSGGTNKVGFNLFCHAARSIGFPGSVKHLFEELDADQDGVIRLGDLDQSLDAGILSLQRLLFGVGPKGIFQKRAGKRTLEEAWAILDVKKNGQLHRVDTDKALAGLGFTGPAREVFEMLDLDGGGFITKDELVFLENWCVPKLPRPIEGRLLEPTGAYLHHKAEAMQTIARLKALEEGSNSVYEHISSKPRGKNPPLPDLTSIRQSFISKSYVKSPAEQQRQSLRDMRPAFPSKPKPLLDNASALSLPDLRQETAMRSLNFSTKYGSSGPVSWAPAALTEKPHLFSTFEPSQAELDEWDAKLKKQAAEAVERTERGEPPP